MFKLLTTLKYTPSDRLEDGVFLWGRHLHRLREGVDALSSFSASDLDDKNVAKEIARAIEAVNGLGQPHRVSLLLVRESKLMVFVQVSVTLDPNTLVVVATAAALTSMPVCRLPLFIAYDLRASLDPVNVVIDKASTQTKSKMLRYKNTDRGIYNESKLRNGACFVSVLSSYEQSIGVSYSTGQDSTFDALMHNENGHITETTIANIFYKFNNDDIWYTPPTDDGLLPGLMRRHLIDRGFCSERSLPLSELIEALDVGVCLAYQCQLKPLAEQ